MNKKNLLEYLRTFVLSLLAALVLVLALLSIIQHQVYEQEKEAPKLPQEETIDHSLVGVLIEKNQCLAGQYPKNYKINLKLGILYEIEKDYSNSEIEYKEAIGKAPYGEFKPSYRLALLYVTLNRLDDAQAVMDNLEEKPDKKLIEYKADVYKKLGDKYYSLSDYENAIERYKKSLSYYAIIKYKKEIKDAKDCLASSYVYLAEDDLNHMNPDEAVNYLKLALALVDAPILKYKVALLIRDDEPNLAYQYFDEVFKKAPEIINYNEYSKFLSTLAANASLQDDITQEELYQYKIKRLQDYFKNNVLSFDDVKLDDIQGKIKTNKLTGKSSIYLKTRVKNVSKNDINSLFVEIIFKDKNKTLGDYSKQIVDNDSILKIGSYSSVISIKLTGIKVSKFDDKPRTVTAEIYAMKTDRSYKLLLKTFDIKEKLEENQINQYIKKFIKNFEFLLSRITSKLPSFLF